MNRAIFAAPCDVWVFCDWTFFRDVMEQVDRVPEIVTTQECANRLNKHNWPKWSHAKHTVWPITTDPPFSFATALQYADTLADRIWIYGNDQTDEPDWDGQSLATNRRTEKRWTKERKVIEPIMEQMKEKICDRS